MRMSLTWVLRAFVCILAPLTLPPPSLAQGDRTNAANITDANLWGQMYQVMTGTGQTPVSGMSIRFPKGIYAAVLVAPTVQDAIAFSRSTMRCHGHLGHLAGCYPAISTKTALTNFFSNILSNPAVSGLVFVAPWSLLNPNWPSVYPTDSAYDWSSLDAAFTAAANLNKTIQIAVDPGFNSPNWLFEEMDSRYGKSGAFGPGSGSCNGLFMDPPRRVNSPCGYTTIFETFETPKRIHKPLPLPWDPTYKSEWSTFLNALNQHIGANDSFVSIGVAGPTAMSEEMMLPNNRNQPFPLTLASYAYGTPSGTKTAAGIDAFSAWNCLLASNYGPKSPYLNSDRAFIEEWAAAIDLYGQVFSGITLTVSTGNSLPDFPTPPHTTGCAISSSISLPAGNPSLTAPPPGFVPDCSASAAWPGGPVWPMDCAAETAILAYFAEPPVGGANAKATQEDALAAWQIDQINGGNMLTTASVKWLSASTAGGLMTMPGSVPGSTPVVSRMLGVSAFSGAFSVAKSLPGEGCAVQDTKTLKTTCTLPDKTPGCLTSTTGGGCGPPPTAEDALFNVLQAYFAGTNVGGSFGVAKGVNAPTNYLQVWWNDFAYAAGMNTPNCTMDDLMMTAPPKPLPCAVPPTATATTAVNGQYMTAQKLLETTSGYIIESAPWNFPLFGYPCPPSPVGALSPVCNSGFVPRGAFNGDAVCVAPQHQTDASNDNTNALSNFAENQSYPKTSPEFLYGTCIANYYWRQAYMGDYVCVSKSEQGQVAMDNAARSFTCAPPPPPPPPPHVPPRPGCGGLPKGANPNC